MAWNNDGKFTAEIVNGVITDLHFCEPGCDEDTAPNKCIISTDIKFLTDVHKALGELLDMVKQQQKDLGYSFPLE